MVWTVNFGYVNFETLSVLLIPCLGFLSAHCVCASVTALITCMANICFTLSLHCLRKKYFLLSIPCKFSSLGPYGQQSCQSTLPQQSHSLCCTWWCVFTQMVCVTQALLSILYSSSCVLIFAVFGINFCSILSLFFFLFFFFPLLLKCL